MKKILKITLITLLVLIVIIAIAGFFGWNYLNKNFIAFEKNYTEKLDFERLTVDGYEFLDRNGNGKLDVYEDDREDIAIRVQDVLSQMTMEEKVHLLKGSGIASALGANDEGVGIPGAVGTIVPTPRLGLPTVYLSDGPAGLRIEPTRPGEDRTYYCTAFPIATVLSSTWNKDLVHKVGETMGEEAKEYGIDVILGPGANIHRHPLTGRNFEYFSEDPVLSGWIGTSIVNGIESKGVGTSVKHYVANNQETDRDINDTRVSERALREIYLKGFEIIVKNAQPWTIMSSYNKVNGTYTSESEYLLTDVLRNEYGFEGLVMSDWFGGRDAVAQVTAGNDLLEPGTKKQWEALKEGVKEGSLSEQIVDRAAGRILTLVFSTRKMQGYKYGNNPDLKAHAAITRQSAAEGMVLLKNEGALPILSAKNVALLGVTSYGFIAGGTGSGDVNEAYTVSLEEGLLNSGFQINQLAKNIYIGHRSANEEKFVKPEGIEAMFNPYSPPEVNYSEDQLVDIANASDIGILTFGRNAGEGGDRKEIDDFLLTNLEADLLSRAVKAFHNVGKKLVVVLNVGGVIETASWKNIPDAIVLAWQGGQEGGNSVADILSGKVNPSGKLPMTFPNKLTDHRANANFPLNGEQHTLLSVASAMLFQRDARKEEEHVKNKDFTNYEEGFYIGYRHFDKANLEVAYPFGYGLSYSKFDFNDLNVNLVSDTVRVTIRIENIGEYAGKEVVQIYTEKLNSTVDRPIRELKAFAKTSRLEPQQSEFIDLEIPISDLQYWNEELNQWVLEKGVYSIKIGNSSRNLYLSEEIQIEN
ncbi:MAG: beta-glucosidase [Bacteroidota bacterium]